MMMKYTLPSQSLRLNEKESSRSSTAIDQKLEGQSGLVNMIVATLIIIVMSSRLVLMDLSQNSSSQTGHFPDIPSRIAPLNAM